MSAVYGHGSANVLQGAPFDLDVRFAAKRAGGGLIGTIRDLFLIALAWTIFIGVILHPGAQIVGIVACALALLFGSARAALRHTAEV